MTWMGNVQRNWYNRTEKRVTQLNIGLSSQSFNLVMNNGNGEFNSRYQKWQPYFNYHFKKKQKHKLFQQIHGRLINTSLESNDGNINNFAEAGYRLVNTTPTLPYRLNGTFRAGPGFSRVSMEWQGSLPYNENKSIDMRFFAGQFLQSADDLNPAYAFQANNRHGLVDYLYDDLVFGRSGNSAFWRRQIIASEGGITTPYLITSNQYLIAANFSGQLPKTPFRIMFNSMLTPDADNNPLLTFEGGLQLVIFKDILSINLPLLYSDNLSDRNFLNNRSNLDNLTFTLTLSNLNVFGYKESPIFFNTL